MTNPSKSILLCFFSASALFGQPSPEDLIKDLTHPPESGSIEGVIVGCGQVLAATQNNRAAARRLANLGPAALPALEKTLDSLAVPAVPQTNGWLLLAYARIKGPEAYSRISKLYNIPSLADYSTAMDNAVALAFGVTSYLSAFRAASLHRFHQCTIPDAPGLTFGAEPCVAPATEIPIGRNLCDRGQQPRDALDDLILGWEANSRPYVEANLGPIARSALNRLLAGKSWERLHAELWPSSAGSFIAIGYQFAISGRSSEPEETLELSRNPWIREPIGAGIETNFKSSSGAACGKLRIHFSESPEGPPQMQLVRYAIDNPDLQDLLRLVAACATGTAR